MFKKTCAVVLSVLTVCLTAACGEEPGPGTNPPSEPAVWTSENIMQKEVTADDMLFGSYVSTFNSAMNISSRTTVKALSDGGLNFMPRAADLSRVGMAEEGEQLVRDLSSADWWQRIDEVMTENNMVYFYASKGGLANDHENVKGSALWNSEQGVSYATRLVPDLSRCIGTYLMDEPSSASYGSIAEWVRRYAGINGTYGYVNLLPGGDYNFYNEYVTTIGAAYMGYLSHDYYIYDSNGGVNYNIFSAIEGMRKVVYEQYRKGYDLELACHPQLSAWSGRRMPNLQEVKYNVNIYLAYGFRTFIYFNYVMYDSGSENCSDAIFDTDGNMLHPELYEQLKEFHLTMRALSANLNLSEYICSRAYHTTKSTGGTTKASVTFLPKNWYFLPQGSDDLILSLMEAKDGGDPIITVMNNSFSETTTSFTVSDLLSEVKLYDAETGRLNEVAQEDGTMTLTFEPCEIKYFKVSGDFD